MSFVYPYFLFALAAVAIPIIIHLFHFRRFKTIYFTNVRFLKELKEETDARQKLRNLLILLMRCLAVIFLVLAFAQPFLPAKNAKGAEGRKDVSIYVDNSFSMQATGNDVPLLEKAKQRALEIVQAYEADDRFQILSSDFEGRDQRLLSKDDAVARIGELKISHAVQPLSKVLARQKQALLLGEAKTKNSFLISDFQKNTVDIQRLADSTVTTTLVPLSAVSSRNVAIDSVWFEAPVQMPNENNVLIVKVHNYSDVAVDNIPLSATVDGQSKPAGLLNIAAGTSAYDTVNITVLNTGFHSAEVKITDYPVEFDDRYFFTFQVKEQIDILQVYNGQPNAAIEAAFRNSTYYKLNSAASGQLDYSKLRDYEAIILTDLTDVSSGLASELATYVSDGGNLLVFPGVNANLASYQTLSSALKANTLSAWEAIPRGVAYLNYDEWVFKGVFENKRENLRLPETKGNYRLSRTADSREEEVLRYRDGGAYIIKNRIGKGTFYLCAAPLNPTYNTLKDNAEIFVPLLYKTALAKGESTPLAHIIGLDNTIETANPVTTATGETVFKLKGEREEFIPEQRILGAKVFLNTANAIQDAGYYDLFLKAGETLDKFAFNYDRRESDLHYSTQEELTTLGGEMGTVVEGSQATDFKQVVGERSRGTALWKYCILFVLLFLALETALVRLFKK